MLMWSTQSPCAAQLINFLPSGVTTAPATPGMSMREAASHFLGVGANRVKSISPISSSKRHCLASTLRRWTDKKYRR